jgi:transposase-like protein
MLLPWYLAYSLSYRDIEELALERGIKVVYSSINFGLKNLRTENMINSGRNQLLLHNMSD